MWKCTGSKSLSCIEATYTHTHIHTRINTRTYMRKCTGQLIWKLIHILTHIHTYKRAHAGGYVLVRNRSACMEAVLHFSHVVNNARQHSTACDWHRCLHRDGFLATETVCVEIRRNQFVPCRCGFSSICV